LSQGLFTLDGHANHHPSRLAMFLETRITTHSGPSNYLSDLPGGVFRWDAFGPSGRNKEDLENLIAWARTDEAGIAPSRFASQVGRGFLHRHTRCWASIFSVLPGPRTMLPENEDESKQDEGAAER